MLSKHHLASCAAALAAVATLSACTTGDDVWSRSLDVAAGPVLVGDVVVAADVDGTLVGLDPDDGRDRWRTEVELAPDLEIREGASDRRAESAADGVATVAPLGGDGVVTLSHRGVVCSYRGTDGERRWCTDEWADEFLTWDGRNHAQLTVDGQGLWVMTRSLEVVAIDPDDGTGRVLTAVEPLTPRTQWIVAAGSLLFTVGQHDDGDAEADADGPVLAGLALDPVTGEVRWAEPRLRDVFDHRIAAAAVDDDLVVVARGSVGRYDVEGRQRWQASEPEDGDSVGVNSAAITTPLVRDDDVLVAIGAARDDSSVRIGSLDLETGQRRWVSGPIATVWRDEVAIETTDDGMVVVRAEDLHVLDGDDGTVLASVPVGKTPSESGTPGLIVAGAEAIVAGPDGIRRFELFPPEPGASERR